MTMSPRLIVLAAGGTGGHMFPAEALARALIGGGHRVALVTDGRGQAFDETVPGAETHRISAATLGPGLGGKIRTAALLARGYGQARRLLKARRPAAVVGFGGYPSLPTVYAAGRLGLRVVLHEQNAVLGRANRRLAGVADRIAVAFPDVAGIAPADRAKVIVTGNPVRPAIAAQAGQGYAPPAADGPVRLLILGGSQGARVFSDIVPAAVALLPAGLRARLDISQQARAEDLDRARAAYGSDTSGRTLAPFFQDVPARMAAAHLVICRAGASTLAELTTLGRPAILVPYPFATDDHQTANARAVAAAGAGWLMPQADFTAEALAARLVALLDDPSSLTAAADAAVAFGHPDAADRLARAVLDLIQANGGPDANTGTSTGNREAAA